MYLERKLLALAGSKENNSTWQSIMNLFNNRDLFTWSSHNSEDLDEITMFGMREAPVMQINNRFMTGSILAEYIQVLVSTFNTEQ
jgi:hypothetical protein